MDYITGSFYFILLIYSTLFLFGALGWINTVKIKNSSSLPGTMVSVIIPARNEENNIEVCLSHLILQNYPKPLFEIIIVDDASTDQTREVVNLFINKYNSDNIKLITLKDEPGIVAYKKRAITEGVKQARGKIIVTTDADCKAGDQWLSSIVAFYEQYSPKMISGPVCFYGENSFFEKAQTLEFMTLITAGGGALYYHLPLMCNGANLVYEKEVFWAVNGFEGIDGIASGDDVLLMQKVHKKYPHGIKFLKNKEAVVYSKPQQNLKDFIYQRRRWASKTFKMKDFWTIFIAAVVVCLNSSLILSLILSVFYNKFVPLFLLLFAGKCVIDILFLFLAASFFAKRRYIWLIIPVQLVYAVYIFLIGIIGNTGKYKWKERVLK